jgi:HEAT repeat protein
VLGYVENKNAGPALFAFATGQAEAPLRTRAMLACGALRDPALLPKYEALLFPKQDAGGDLMASDGVAIAAAWSVAKLGDKRAAPLLRRLAQSGEINMRAYAVLGLGLLHDKSSVPLLAATARALDSGAIGRAAAAYALGEVGANGEATTLVTLAEGTDALPREMAVLALARLGMHKGEPPGGRAAVDAMADAVFAGDAETGRARLADGATLREAAAASLVRLATKGAAEARPDPLPAPDENVDAESTLDQLVPKKLAAKDRAAALVAFAEPLKRAATSALATSSERARAVLDALGTREGTLEPFVSAGEDGPEMAAAHAKAREIAAALEPNVVALSRHPDPAVRMKGLVLLSRSSSDVAAGSIADAVTDPNESVQRVALASIGRHADAKAVLKVAKIMHTHESWAMRVLAAQALGRLGGAGASAEATKELREAALKESYALVREAALVALAGYDKAAARDVARTMATKDPEPRLRQTANQILAGK